ncbi:MAG: glycosyltransferase family 2 protein [Candidatus Peribacteraceae bacterium]|jgi:dolichol-phosphate mannosyltransferase|nr:glycosyltransferase family 2 protein [Candidatus Peribacteraceae bacterium]
MRALVVIPTFNERENISPLIDQIMELDIHVDVLVVDDSSPDGTADAVREKQEQYDDKQIQLLVRPKGKSGRGSACIAGLQYAKDHEYDAAIEMDADHSHHPKYIPDLLAKLSSADVSVASRRVPGSKVIGWKWHRHLLSFAAHWYVRIILRLPIKDVTNGFRCYGKRALLHIPELTIDGIGFSVIPQMSYQLHHLGMTFAEVPFVFTDRLHGSSNMGMNEITESFIAIFMIRSKPLYIHAKQLFKFCLTGVINGITDLGLLAIFVELLHMPIRIAVPLAGLIALTNAFFINKKWTFRCKDSRYFKQYLLFLAVYGSSFVFGAGLTIFLVEQLSVWYLLARIIIIPLAALWNYSLLHLIVFRGVRSEI